MWWNQTYSQHHQLLMVTQWPPPSTMFQTKWRRLLPLSHLHTASLSLTLRLASPPFSRAALMKHKQPTPSDTTSDLGSGAARHAALHACVSLATWWCYMDYNITNMEEEEEGGADGQMREGGLMSGDNCWKMFGQIKAMRAELMQSTESGVKCKWAGSHHQEYSRYLLYLSVSKAALINTLIISLFKSYFV